MSDPQLETLAMRLRRLDAWVAEGMLAPAYRDKAILLMQQADAGGRNWLTAMLDDTLTTPQALLRTIDILHPPVSAKGAVAGDAAASERVIVPDQNGRAKAPVAGDVTAPSASAEMQVPAPSAQDKIDLGDVKKLTPRGLLQLAGRLTISSWLMAGGLFFGLAAGAFATGWAFGSGELPAMAYSAYPREGSPLEARKQREASAAWSRAYSDIVDWAKLRPIASSIARHKPDGLDNEFEIAASLLAQLRSSAGKAAFLAGNKQISVVIKPGEGSMALEWEETDSIIPRIARDAGYTLSERELKIVNSNINFAQFSYLDDAMKHAVIYRLPNGNLMLSIFKDR